MGHERHEGSDRFGLLVNNNPTPCVFLYDDCLVQDLIYPSFYSLMGGGGSVYTED
jgi:hypothetical protein